MTQDYNNMTEAELIEIVTRNCYAITHIKNQPEPAQLIVVREDGSLIKYLENPTELVQIAAIKQCLDAIYYIALDKLFKSAYALALILDPSLKNVNWFRAINKDELR